MQIKIKKILYLIRIALLVFPIFSVLFVTIITSNELTNGVVSGKYFLFFMSMGLIAVSLPIFLFTKKKSLIRVNDAIVVFFLLTLLLNFTFTNHEVIMTKHILLILLLNLYFIFRFIFIKTNKNVIYWFIICFIITGLVEAIWGLRQLYGFERSQHGLFLITGSFFNPGPYACYVSVIFPMAL